MKKTTFKYAAPMASHIEQTNQLAFERVQASLKEVFDVGGMRAVHHFMGHTRNILSRLKTAAVMREYGDVYRTPGLVAVTMYNEIPKITNDILAMHRPFNCD